MSDPFGSFSILDDVNPEFYLGSSFGSGHARPEYRQISGLAGAVAIVMAAELVFFTAVGSLAVGSTEMSGLPSGYDLFTSFGVAVLLLNLFSATKLYRVEVIGNFRQFCRRFAGALALLAVTGGVACAVASKIGTPGLPLWNLADLSALSLLCMVGARYAASELFLFCVRRGYLSHNVVVLGTPELANQFAEQAHKLQLGVRVTAVFDHEVGPSSPEVGAKKAASVGVTDLLRYSKRHPIDTVVLALPALHTAELDALVRQLNVQPLRIRRMPSPWKAQDNWLAPPGDLPGMNLLPVSNPPIGGLSRLLKNTLDVSVALVALLFFGPLMLICALGIKMSSPGPIFFRQKRIGYRNREFSVFKFRTMHMAGCNTGRLTLRNDPRVFALGRIMRKLSLDELPQLLNVLKGDMSLVGPRPHMPEAMAAGQFYHHAVPTYAARHRVKPGITGWAQVNGWRGPTETLEQIEQRVSHDLHYIEKWTLWLDVKILVKTAFVGFFGKNAF